MANAIDSGQRQGPSEMLAKFQANLKKEEGNLRRYSFKRHRIPRETAVLFSVMMRAVAANPRSAVAEVLKLLLERVMDKNDRKLLLALSEEEIDDLVNLLFREVGGKKKSV